MPGKSKGHTRRIIVDGDIAKVELTQGYWTIIDAEDLPRVSQHSWYYHAVSRGQLPTARAKINGKVVLLHRFIMGCVDRSQVCDHISGDSLDNRKANLRVGTYASNARNIAKIASKSGFRGIVFRPNRSKPGQLYPRVGNKKISLGYFKNTSVPALLFDCIQIKIAQALGYPVSLRVLNYPDLLEETSANSNKWLNEILSSKQLAKLEAAIVSYVERASCDSTYLYLATRADGATKIGVSRDPDVRVSKIRYGYVKGSCPSTSLLASYLFPTAEAAYRAESELHELFSQKRVEGEFFNLEEEDLKIIEQKFNP